MRSLWRRLRTVALTDVSVLVKGVPHETIEEFERLLLEADFGPATFELVEALERESRRGRLKSEQALRDWLIEQLISLVEVPNRPDGVALGDRIGPAVIVMVGVNGVGKTTQAAKLAHWLMRRGETVLLAAADTYRAGAIDQLKIWADRLGIECVAGSPGGDPAAVAFDAVGAAMSRNVGVVIIDTAGRLHTQGDLMVELQKVIRVTGRRREGAPHECFLVLDGTVGQNAIQQATQFADAVPLSGLILTKMDGTARGGAVVGVQRQLGVPVRFIGTGETLDDFGVFEPRNFAASLLSE